MDIEYNYIINSGKFVEQDNQFPFQGEQIERVNPLTGQSEKMLTNGEILFSEIFNEGKMSFDVSFDKVYDDTRVGFFINYQNINGKLSFYQIGIRNRFTGYGIDYYNGQAWEFKVGGGQVNFIRAKVNYLLTVELKGNVIRLYVNNVKVLEYTNFTDVISGVCGIYIMNGATATIKNIVLKHQKPSVFCIMKFERDFDDLYKDVIKPQCDKLGFHAVRADECYTSSAIIQDIIREISNASIIISDITMDNPNVFYELGYAHALQKPTILLADIDKRDRLPFDISGYRTIFYSNTIAGKKEIESHLRKYMENIAQPNFLPRR